MKNVMNDGNVSHNTITSFVHPRNAIVSVVIGILVFSATISALGYAVSLIGGRADVTVGWLMAIGSASLLLFLLSAVGMFFGVFAVFRKDAKKGLAWSGLVLNGLVFISTLVELVLGGI